MQYRGLNINIIPEEVEISNKAKMLEYVKNSLKDNPEINDSEFKDSFTTVIDREEWLVQDANIRINEIRLTYRWYLFTGYGKSVQLLFYAPIDQFVIQEKLIDKIAKTFHIGR